MKFSTLKEMSFYLQDLIEKRLWAKVLLSILLGVITGFLISKDMPLVSSSTSEIIGNWLAVPGTLFLKLVQMIMIPLIFTSIISGITTLEKDQLKKLGPNVVAYFIFTTLLAVIIGSFIAYYFSPGSYFKLPDSLHLTDKTPSTELNIDLKYSYEYILNLLPTNPLASMVSGEMLSIVIFTIIVGIALSSLSSSISSPLLQLIYSVQEVCMIVVNWSMKLVPYAVFGLIAQLTSTVGIDSILGLGTYMMCVLLGLLILMIIYSIFLFVLAKRNPFLFFSKIKEVQLLAFSTTSSAAVMPLSLKVAEENYPFILVLAIFLFLLALHLIWMVLHYTNVFLLFLLLKRIVLILTQ